MEKERNVKLIKRFKKIKNQEKIIPTFRKNGKQVGREVSRQRRWQIRNSEKHTIN